MGGMPGLWKAKKDVISCEKPRGGLANTNGSADIRMGGNPVRVDRIIPIFGRKANVGGN